MKIELKYLPIVRLVNNETFIVPEKLEIEFESVYVLDKLVVEVQQGNLKRKYVVTDKKVDLSEFTKQAGIIEIHVSLMALGKVAKAWEIEPIVVIETEGVFVIKNYIETLIAPLQSTTETLTQNINDLIGIFNELAEKHNELAKTVSAVKENF